MSISLSQMESWSVSGAIIKAERKKKENNGNLLNQNVRKQRNTTQLVKGGVSEEQDLEQKNIQAQTCGIVQNAHSVTDVKEEETFGTSNTSNVLQMRNVREMLNQELEELMSQKRSEMNCKTH
jgi:hypothetical protein